MTKFRGNLAAASDASGVADDVISLSDSDDTEAD